MPDTALYTVMYILVFLYGITIGSFLNVCIFRIPKGEGIVLERSHCMTCGYQLAWYDLVPLFSFLILRGRCRKCQTKLSLQYPLVEGLNGALYVAVFLADGWNYLSVVYCFLTSALIVLSVIDFRTMEIPYRLSLALLVLGAIATGLDWRHWKDHVIGLFSVSVFLFVILNIGIFVLKKGILGLGDVEMMAGTGLLLGWQRAFAALVLACIIGSVVHGVRMLITHTGHELAFGPYLSVGIWISALWGQELTEWYIRLILGT